MSARERTGRRRPPAAPVFRVLRSVGRLSARAYLVAAAGLLLWTLLPTAFGLTPVVVRTGSMAPAVQPGDVLVVQRVALASVRPGQVLLVNDPAHPGRLLSHRVVAVADGLLTTRGDANAAADSTPVPASAVRGIARLRVPFVGRPAVWWWQGRVGLVAAWLLATVAALWLSQAQPRREGIRGAAG